MSTKLLCQFSVAMLGEFLCDFNYNTSQNKAAVNVKRTSVAITLLCVSTGLCMF